LFVRAVNAQDLIARRRAAEISAAVSQCEKELVRYQDALSKASKDAARLEQATRELATGISELGAASVSIRQSATSVPDNNVHVRLPDLTPLQVRTMMMRMRCVCACECRACAVAEVARFGWRVGSAADGAG
jgi:hypothetical protein